MDTIKVALRLEYAPELSHAEFRPLIWAYFDSGISCDPVEVSFPGMVEDGSPYPPVDIVLEGTYNGREPLPDYTKIVFYASATRYNEHGSPCPIDVGLGMIDLIDVIQDVAGTYNQTVPLKLYTCDGLEKGRLRVTRPRSLITQMRSIKWASSPVSSSVTASMRRLGAPASVVPRFAGEKEAAPRSGPDAVKHLMRDWAKKKLTNAATSGGGGEPAPDDVLPIEQKAWKYIQATMGAEQAMPNTDPETGNVRVPIYFGDVGMARRVPLPAVAFMLFSTPRSNLFFWSNMLEVVLRRDSKNVHDVKGLNLTQRCRLVAELCCGLVQSLDYIPDLVDKNRRYRQRVEGFLAGSPEVAYDPRKVAGCERFGDALRDTVGDCEDLALAISMILTAFLEAGDAGMFDGLPHFIELHRIARQYVAFVTLDSVTAQAIKAEQDKNRDSTGKVLRELGAHMAVKFLPAVYVRDCILRQLLEENGGDMEKAEQDLPPFVPFSEDAAELVVMVGEGTGMFECWGIEIDPISGERICVYSNMASLSFAKKPIVHPPRVASTFYVGTMIGLTNYWFRLGYNLGGVWFGYGGRFADRNLGDGGKTFQRGVKFIEMQNRSNKMCIKMQGIIDDDLMAWMKVAVRIRVKPRDLILTPEGKASHPVKNMALEKIVEHTRSLGREERVKQEPAPVYALPRQLTDAVVNAVLKDINKYPFINEVVYRLESLTDWIYSYYVGVHANAR